MKPACFRCHPDFLKWFLQVDHDLGAVEKRQRQHVSGALAIHVSIGVVIIAIARHFDCCDRLLGQVLVFKVRHYNPFMVFQNKILGASAQSPHWNSFAKVLFVTSGAVLTLEACGQQGPLFLPPTAELGQKVPAVVPTTSENKVKGVLPIAPSPRTADPH